MFPELEIVTDPPPSKTPEALARLEEQVTFDIDEMSTGEFSKAALEVIRSREQRSE
jgi:hypothetical protein